MLRQILICLLALYLIEMYKIFIPLLKTTWQSYNYHDFFKYLILFVFAPVSVLFLAQGRQRDLIEDAQELCSHDWEVLQEEKHFGFIVKYEICKLCRKRHLGFTQIIKAEKN